MRVRIEQSVLNRVMARAASVAAKRSTILILGNVLLEADGDGVSVTATDLDMEIRERVAASVDRAGAVTVNAGRLADIARHAPAGAEVLIDWDAQSEPRAVVAFGRSRYLLPVVGAGDFPRFGDLDEAVALALPAGDLATLLDRVHFAQSTDEVRYFICGTFFTTASVDGVAMFRVVATDGHRLVLDERPLGDQPVFKGVIVPRAAVQEFRRLLAGSSETTRLFMSPRGVALEIGETRLITKVIDGAYPDYERPIPRRWNREVRLDREAFREAIKRVSLVNDAKDRKVKLTIEDELLKIEARSTEQSVASEQIEVEGEGPHFETGYNAKYLLDVLEQTDADRMVYRFSDGADPARLEPIDGGAEGLINVVMPLRF